MDQNNYSRNTLQTNSSHLNLFNKSALPSEQKSLHNSYISSNKSSLNYKEKIQAYHKLRQESKKVSQTVSSQGNNQQLNNLFLVEEEQIQNGSLHFSHKSSFINLDQKAKADERIQNLKQLFKSLNVQTINQNLKNTTEQSRFQQNNGFESSSYYNDQQNDTVRIKNGKRNLLSKSSSQFMVKRIEKLNNEKQIIYPSNENQVEQIEEQNVSKLSGSNHFEKMRRISLRRLLRNRSVIDHQKQRGFNLSFRPTAKIHQQQQKEKQQIVKSQSKEKLSKSIANFKDINTISYYNDDKKITILNTERQFNQYSSRVNLIKDQGDTYHTPLDMNNQSYRQSINQTNSQEKLLNIEDSQSISQFTNQRNIELKQIYDIHETYIAQNTEKYVSEKQNAGEIISESKNFI